jgi:6-phosphogluconolactonase
MKILRGLLLGLLALGTARAADDYLAYFGGYTGAKSKGIYVARFDSSTGKLGAPELAAETTNPSFLAIHPSHRFIYAVGEMSGAGKKAGAVSAFAVDAATGHLKLLNQEPSGGSGPCYVGLDNAGRNALVANYGSGSVAVLPVKDDGTLCPATAEMQHAGSSVNPKRQTGPHAHSIFLDAANHFAFAPDLGLDKIMSYRFDSAKGTLTPNDPPFTAVAPGSGPRHFTFHPNGKFAYVINEMLCTVTAFAYDAERGALKEIETVSTLPAGEKLLPSYSCAEIRVGPTGKFLYGSNRGHNTIAVFTLDPDTGKLQLIENAPTLGKIPRNFNFDPTGKWLLAAHQTSDNVVVFRIDPATGKLTPTGQQVEVVACVCIKFMPLP